MKNFLKMIVLGLLLNSQVFGSAPDWQLIDTTEGIQIYKKVIEGSPIVAFRGEAIIEAPIGKVVHVLVDNKHRKDWVDRLVTTTVLEKPGLYEQTMYQEFDAPWPVSNRDLVFRGKIKRDEETGMVSIRFKSVDDVPNAPKTTGVRGHLESGIYELTPIDKNKTRLNVELISDPKGFIPKFVVNIVQKSWPYKTISALRKQVNKDFVKDIDLFAENMKEVIRNYKD